MFAGLVATASSRSSSHSSASSTSPLRQEEDEEWETDVLALHTHASSPRTDGPPPSSTEFLSPVSAGYHTTPSTVFRQARGPYAALRDHSPSMLRSWGTPSMGDRAVDEEEEEEEEQRNGLAGDAAHVSPLSSLSGEDHVSDEDEEEQWPAWTVAAERRATPASPPLSSASPGRRTLEVLASQRSSSSSSSSSRPGTSPRKPQSPLPPSPSHATAPLTEPKESPVSPPSVPAAAPARHLAPQDAEAVKPAKSAASLSPITPPFAAAPLSPLTTRASTSSHAERERSGTLEGGTFFEKSCASSPSSPPAAAAAAASATLPSSASSTSSYRAPTPFAPPPNSPPDSAMKPPPGTVMVDCSAREEGPLLYSSDNSKLQVTAVLRGNDQLFDSSPFFFETQYTEEEHRVRLETQETEELRCIFRAHKAVLTLYQMWAAEDAVADAARGVTPPSKIPLIADRPHAASMPLQTGEKDSVRSSSSAAERVQHFLNASIEHARERRSASTRSVSTEATTSTTVPLQRTTASAIDYGSVRPEERRSTQLGSLLPPPPALSTSAVSLTSAPEASRLLEYSSVLAADIRGSVDSSFVGGRPARSSPSAQRQPPSRLFSPWRSDRPAQREPSPSRMKFAEAAPIDDAAATLARSVAHRVRAGDGVGVNSALIPTPLIPRIRRSSSSGAAHLATSPRLSVAAQSADGGSWRREGRQRTIEASTSRRSPPQVPSSLLSDTFLSLTRHRLDAERRRAGERERERDTAPGSAGATHVSGALVRSPRVAVTDASPTRRRHTPPWNTSPNVRSTAAAGRRVVLDTANEEEGNQAALRAATTREALGFVPNTAFHQRQRAASLTPPSSGPVDATTPAPPHGAAPPAQLSSERRRRDRLSSYVQYKRFFDAAYGTRDASPGFSRGPPSQTTVQRQANFHRTTARAAETNSVRYPAAMSRAAVGHTVHPDRPFSSSFSATRHTWSPDSHPRRAVPHPTTHSSPSAMSVSTAQWPSTSLTGVDSDGVSYRDVAAYADMYAARLHRLCTLERLCRAELQRRWMEDQSALLHRFVMEGTAVLQRVRALARATSAPPLPAQRGEQRGRQLFEDGVLPDARAWTFIPNEME